MLGSGKDTPNERVYVLYGNILNTPLIPANELTAMDEMKIGYAISSANIVTNDFHE